jgi:hypothetical protein
VRNFWSPRIDTVHENILSAGAGSVSSSATMDKLGSCSLASPAPKLVQPISRVEAAHSENSPFVVGMCRSRHCVERLTRPVLDLTAKTMVPSYTTTSAEDRHVQFNHDMADVHVYSLLTWFADISTSSAMCPRRETRLRRSVKLGRTRWIYCAA